MVRPQRFRITAAVLALLVFVAGCAVFGGTPDKDGEESGNSSSENAIGRTIDAMTLDEKIGQLIIAGVEGASPDRRARRMIAEQHVGGVIFYKDNLVSPEETVVYVNSLRAWNGANKAPLMLSVDQEGGIVSRLPGLERLPDAVAIGETGQPAFAGAVGELLARACTAFGFNLNFAPVLDINSNPDNPVIGPRSFGATPEVVTQMGVAEMKAIRDAGIIPVVKHFPGHGDTAVDSHLELPVVRKGLEQLRNFEWQPFAEAIRQGADAVMVAHILFPQLDGEFPSSLSRTIITDQLRGTLGFEGVVMTDDLTMGAIADHYGIGDAAVQAVEAGSDIVLVAHGYDNVDRVVQALKQSVNEGRLTEKRIDESVERILQLKERYRLADKPVAIPELDGINADIRAVLKQYRQG